VCDEADEAFVDRLTVARLRCSGDDERPKRLRTAARGQPQVRWPLWARCRDLGRWALRPGWYILRQEPRLRAGSDAPSLGDSRCGLREAPQVDPAGSRPRSWSRYGSSVRDFDALVRLLVVVGPVLCADLRRSTRPPCLAYVTLRLIPTSGQTIYGASFVCASGPCSLIPYRWGATLKSI
jgi:hypothetical protein